MNIYTCLLLLCFNLIINIDAKSETAIFDDIMKGVSDPREIPPDVVTDVRVGMYMVDMNKIDSHKMKYSMTIYFRQQWTDPRLQFDETLTNNKSILIDPHRWEEIWTPDTFFRNEKSRTVINRLLKLSPNGRIWYVQQMNIQLSCPMHLQRFPFDTQRCPLMIESFAMTHEEMQLSWLPSPVDVDSNIRVPQFTLTETMLYNCTQTYLSGTFPCLEIQFILNRDSGSYVAQIFFPCILIIFLAWTSFWFGRENVVVRCLIGLICFLALIMKDISIKSAPQTAYAKALDVWWMVSYLYIIFLLLELALVRWMSARDKEESKDNEEKGTWGKRAEKIDFISRIVFIGVFILFLIIYFSAY